jgi:hypothetical protein
MEMEHPDHDPEIDLSAVERRLAAWRPSAGSLDRDRMLYNAGRAAANADGRVQTWRLATAALALLAVGMGGLMLHERSQRRAMEVALGARSRPSQSASTMPLLSATPTIEPFAPSSYFVLTSRLSRSNPDMLSPDVEFESRPPSIGPLEPLPQRRPLQLRDLQRVLDL